MTYKIDFESQKSALLVSWFPSFGKRYEIDLKVIFYQWPKLGLGLNVEAEIQILEVIYYIYNPRSNKQLYGQYTVYKCLQYLEPVLIFYGPYSKKLSF